MEMACLKYIRHHSCSTREDKAFQFFLPPPEKERDREQQDDGSEYYICVADDLFPGCPGEPVVIHPIDKPMRRDCEDHGPRGGEYDTGLDLAAPADQPKGQQRRLGPYPVV